MAVVHDENATGEFKIAAKARLTATSSPQMRASVQIKFSGPARAFVPEIVRPCSECSNVS